MTREIKFRIWDNKLKEYYAPIYNASKGELYELLLEPSGRLIKREIVLTTTSDQFPDRYVIEQFTGLFDANNVGIFEGDICQVESTEVGNICKGVITWSDEQACWLCGNFPIFNLRDSGYYQPYTKTPPPWNGQGFEILGNIHDNPELVGATS